MLEQGTVWSFSMKLYYLLTFYVCPQWMLTLLIILTTFSLENRLVHHFDEYDRELIQLLKDVKADRAFSVERVFVWSEDEIFLCRVLYIILFNFTLLILLTLHTLTKHMEL